MPVPAASTSVAVEVAAGIDAAVAGPVLVVGSLPPGGRDLDLLATPGDHATIRDWLAEAGFVPWGHTWARLHEPGPYAVELLTTDSWGASSNGVSCLFADAEPIPGLRHLASPGPAAVLLLAARGTVTRRGGMTDKVRRRVATALARDPDAWDVAEMRAKDLGMAGSLRLLRAAYEADAPLSPVARVAGLLGVLRGEGPMEGRLRTFTTARPKRVKPAIVSFSGLDGSGKSTQADQLQEFLGRLGVGSERCWAGFKAARMVRAALPFLDRPSRAARHAPEPRDRLVPTGMLHSPRDQQVWAYVVVGVNTAYLWWLVLRRRRGSRVLVFDRFSPDTMVKLNLVFERKRGIDSHWQRRLFSLVSPKPDVGFLVDVSSQVAYERRQEQTPEELATMSELYEEQVAPFRLHRLDGTEAAEELADQVAAAVWRGLGR